MTGNAEYDRISGICLVWILLSTPFSSATGYAQAESLPSVKITESPDGHVFLGRDPSQPLDQFKQLDDPQVCAELGMSDEVVSQISEFKKARQEEYAKMMRAERSGEIPRGSLAKLLVQHIEQAEDLLEEVLTPAQRKRLKELMFRLEVERIGLGEALTAGRLSIAVGVHEDQKFEIQERAKKLEQEIQVLYRKMKNDAEKEILLMLAPEQRRNAEEILGAPFEYENWSYAQLMYMNKKQQLSKLQEASVQSK